MLSPQEIIRRKRNSAVLSPAAIDTWVSGITDRSWSDSQIAALAMACCFTDLTLDERVRLTCAMAQSGRVLDWSALADTGPIVDKHSSGGIGDKVSLILAPLLAACGVFVPMISGRGLGHTGGTLDKLDSIPGYDSSPSLTAFSDRVTTVGCAIAGATAELAPADQRLYAIRDITATVESDGLIIASILAKKLAAGVQTLVLDIKTGSGAFAATPDQAQQLARGLVEVARRCDLPAMAVISDMNQVLGTNAGNALEIAEVIAFLTSSVRHPRLLTLVMELAGLLLVKSQRYADRRSADAALSLALENGRAAERFEQMVAAAGGPTDLLTRSRKHLPGAAHIKPCLARSEGFITAIDVRRLGLAIMGLGGGRVRPDSRIDYSVGLSQVQGIGQYSDAHTPLALVHASTPESVANALPEIRAAFRLSDNHPHAPTPLLYGHYD